MPYRILIKEKHAARPREIIGNDQKRNLWRNIGGLRWAQNSNRIVLIIIGFQSGLRVVTETRSQQSISVTIKRQGMQKLKLGYPSPWKS